MRDEQGGVAYATGTYSIAIVQGQGDEMANAFIARQRQHPQEQDAVQYKLACDAPPPVDWRSEARRALASDRLSLDDSGRILRAAGAPTGFMIDPLINGRSVYIRDEYGTRYWLGSPNRLRAVLRWLLS